MFMCVYQKSDNIVVEVRNDTSVPQTTTAAQYFNMYCEDNEVSPAGYDFAVMAFQKIEFILGKYLYDKNTDTMVINPDWIPPPAPETASIPVSDPAGA
jgi:hypothetical protein